MKDKNTDTRLSRLVLDARKAASEAAASVVIEPKSDAAPVSAKSAATALTAAAGALVKAAEDAMIKDPADNAGEPAAQVGKEETPPKENPEPTDPIQPVEQTGSLIDDGDVEQAAKEASAAMEVYEETLKQLCSVKADDVVTFLQSKEAAAVTDEEMEGIPDPEQAAIAEYADEAMQGAEGDAVQDADAVASFLAAQEGEGMPEEGMPEEGGQPEIEELLAAMEQAGISPEEIAAAMGQTGAPEGEVPMDDGMEKMASVNWSKLNHRQKSAAVANMVIRLVAPGLTEGIAKSAADASKKAKSAVGATENDMSGEDETPPKGAK